MTDWFWLNPYPQGNNLTDVCMVDSNTVFAAGDFATVVSTFNGGKTWQVKSHVNGLSVQFIRITMGSKLDGFIFCSNGEILQTNNGGINWVKVDNPFGLTINSVSFFDQNNCIATCNGGTIIHSSNAGINWRISGVLPDSIKGDIYCIDSTVWMIGKWRTSDAGITWKEISIFLGNLHFYNHAIGLATSSLISRTSDGGNTWQVVYYPGPELAYDAVLTSTIEGVGVGKLMPGAGHGAAGEILVSSDSGLSWGEISQDQNAFPKAISTAQGKWCAVGDAGLIIKGRGTSILGTVAQIPGFNVLSVAFSDPSNGTLVAAKTFLNLNELMVYNTVDGGLTWNYLQGLGNAYLPSANIKFSFNKTFGGILESAHIPFYQTYDLGKSWWKVNIPSGSFNDFYFIDARNCWLVGENILKTTNGGESWDNIQNNVSYNSIDFCDSLHGVIVGNAGECLRTSNGGINWQSSVKATNVNLKYVRLFNLNDGIAIGDSGVIIKTFDGGYHWTAQITPSISGFISVSFVDVNTGVLAVGDQTIFTNDGGVTWQATLERFQDVVFIQSPLGAYLLKNRSLPKYYSANNVINTLSDNALTVYGVGEGGKVKVAAFGAYHPKIWNGSVDSSWFTSENWTPTGVPLPGDSIVIPPFVPNDPVINKAQQQIVISSLLIQSGGQLTITDSLSRFVVMADVLVKGKLEVRPPAQTTIVVGGSWVVNSDSTGGFMPAKSTVYLVGSGTVEDNFYNIVFDTASNIISARNVRVDKQCTALKNFNLRSSDTLYINDSIPQALIGTGIIPEGTVSRTILSGSTEPYRFESEGTYVQFESNELVYPAAVNVTTYPKTDPATYGSSWQPVGGIVDTSIKRMTIMKVRSKGKWAIGVPKLDENERAIQAIDSSFVQRVYSIDEIGETDASVTLSLRYESSEVPTSLSQNALQLYWMPNLPEVVKLAYPNDDGVMGRKSLEFRWHKPKERVSEYRFELCIDSLFLWNVADLILPDTTIVIDSVEGLMQYWWRVRARNEYGWSEGRNARKLQVTLMGVDEKENIPKEYSISQNYPNPFNPVTVIKYQLPRESRVTLKIYNTLGQVVTMLVDATQSAGYKSVEWNASRFTSGVYFYELDAIDIAKPDNIFNQVRKMIILK